MDSSCYLVKEVTYLTVDQLIDALALSMKYRQLNTAVLPDILKSLERGWMTGASSISLRVHNLGYIIFDGHHRTDCMRVLQAQGHQRWQGHEPIDVKVYNSELPKETMIALAFGKFFLHT